MITNWRALITAAMKLHGETWADVIGEAPPEGGWGQRVQRRLWARRWKTVHVVDA